MQERDAASQAKDKEQPGRFRQVIKNTANTFRVTPQWQVPAIIFGGITGMLAYTGVERFSEGRFTEGAFLAAGTFLSGSITSVCEYGAVAYVRDYNQMKRLIENHGWDERVVYDRTDYYCGRRAARYAAKDTGYNREFDIFLQQKGIS